MSLSGGDNVDIMSDMYYKFLVHDCMWSGTCKEDNTHETTNKFSDFSYFSTSPVYGSIFDIFNIDDENSLGELNCDPGYTDTSDQDDSPLNGLSAAEDTEIVDDSNLFSTPCSSSSASSTSTLTGSTISPAGLLADAPSSSSTSIKPANSRATLTGKSSGSTTKSTLSSKATKSASSKANKSTISVATTAGSSGTCSVSSATTSIATSIVTPTISPSALNSVLSINDNTNSPPVTPTIPTSANSPTVNLTAVAATAAAGTTSILKNTGKPRNSKSLYPERRKEHNNSEKKRRDHLRNAFNHLRDQIPKLKDGEKKAARVTILKESVSYVTLLKEKHRYLERTKNAETIKHENLLKRLKMLQSSTGATFINSNNDNSIKKNDTIDNDSNLVYVQQCNSSTVC